MFAVKLLQCLANGQSSSDLVEHLVQFSVIASEYKLALVPILEAAILSLHSSEHEPMKRSTGVVYTKKLAFVTGTSNGVRLQHPDLDTWRRKLDDMPSRPEAVRRLLAGVLRSKSIVVKGKR